MEEKEINVHVAEGVKELVIRHGDALALKEPVKRKFEGILCVPGDYYQKRKGVEKDSGVLGKLKIQLNADNSIVIINVDAKKITLIEDDRDAYSHEVVGTLELFPEIEEMGINTNKMLDEKSLLKLLLYKRRWFEDLTEYNALIEGLKKFNFVMNGSGANENDHQGNIRLTREKQVRSNIELKFKLRMPLYKNEEPKSFYVDIRVDVSDGGKVLLWLESIELFEMLEEQAEQLLLKEAARFEELPIVWQ